MTNQNPGLIEPGLWCLGRRESTVYLLEGSHDVMLISGGTSFILPDVLEQLASFGLDISQITKSLILHAHFDHIGIIPYFKRKNPDITVYALERGWEILKMDKADFHHQQLRHNDGGTHGFFGTASGTMTVNGGMMSKGKSSKKATKSISAGGPLKFMKRRDIPPAP